MKDKMNKEEIIEKNKLRAIGYALSLVSFQEVGIGPDENLQRVREIVNGIIELCRIETGIELTNYPTEFLKENKELLMNKKLPYTLVKIFENEKSV